MFLSKCSSRRRCRHNAPCRLLSVFETLPEILCLSRKTIRSRRSRRRRRENRPSTPRPWPPRSGSSPESFPRTSGTQRGPSSPFPLLVQIQCLQPKQELSYPHLSRHQDRDRQQAAANIAASHAPRRTSRKDYHSKLLARNCFINWSRGQATAREILIRA
jgi:hypothetical protein